MPKQDFSRFVVITRRVKQVPDAHGGAWKVAYADFVTAMMAFFLLLWLLNAATRAQVSGVAEYFAQTEPIDNQQVTSLQLGPGELEGEDDQTNNPLSFESSNPAVLKLLKKPQDFFTGNTDIVVDKTLMREEDNIDLEPQVKPEVMENTVEGVPLTVFESSDSNVEEENTMLIESRKDGLNVNIAHTDGVFEPGTATFTPQGLRQMAQISTLISYNYVDVSLHIEGYASQKASDNLWKLSLQRSYQAMRWLIDNGFKQENIESVDGFAAKSFLNPDDPSAFINDRVVLKFIAFDQLQNFDG